MLAVGCRFTEVLTDWRRMKVPDRLVQVDLDAEQIGMNFPVVVGIVADADAACRALLEALPVSTPARGGTGWGPLWDEARAARHPQSRMADRDPAFGAARRRPGVHRRLRDRLPDAGRLAVVRPSRVLLPVELHHAGLGVPGGRRAPPRRWATGRSSRSAATAASSCAAQELATAARYRLRIIAIVHNDSTLGAIKNIQDRAHEGRYLDTELNNPDFPAAGRRLRRPRPPRAQPRGAHRRRPRGARLRRPLAHRGPRPLAVPPRPGQPGDPGEVIAGPNRLRGIYRDASLDTTNRPEGAEQISPGHRPGE